MEPDVQSELGAGKEQGFGGFQGLASLTVVDWRYRRFYACETRMPPGRMEISGKAHLKM